MKLFTSIYDGIKTDSGRINLPLDIVLIDCEDPLNWNGHLDKTDTAYDKSQCLLVLSSCFTPRRKDFPSTK